MLILLILLFEFLLRVVACFQNYNAKHLLEQKEHVI